MNPARASLSPIRKHVDTSRSWAESAENDGLGSHPAANHSGGGQQTRAKQNDAARFGCCRCRLKALENRYRPVLSRVGASDEVLCVGLENKCLNRLTYVYSLDPGIV